MTRSNAARHAELHYTDAGFRRSAWHPIGESPHHRPSARLRKLVHPSGFPARAVSKLRAPLALNVLVLSCSSFEVLS